MGGPGLGYTTGGKYKTVGDSHAMASSTCTNRLRCDTVVSTHDWGRAD